MPKKHCMKGEFTSHQDLVVCRYLNMDIYMYAETLSNEK